MECPPSGNREDHQLQREIACVQAAGPGPIIRDRIRELRRVPAKDLLPNPKNWRRHPKAQANALRGLLEEIGYADALLARKLPDGKLMLIDGHLRAETTPDLELPVLILDSFGNVVCLPFSWTGREGWQQNCPLITATAV